MGAARHWLGAGGGKDEVEEDARVFGITIDYKPAREFTVLPQNWDIVMAFLTAQTQWRYTGNGQITGLDYQSVKLAVKTAGYKFKAVFAGLRVMEAEVLSNG